MLTQVARAALDDPALRTTAYLLFYNVIPAAGSTCGAGIGGGSACADSRLRLSEPPPRRVNPPVLRGYGRQSRLPAVPAKSVERRKTAVRGQVVANPVPSTEVAPSEPEPRCEVGAVTAVAQAPLSPDCGAPNDACMAETDRVGAVSSPVHMLGDYEGSEISDEGSVSGATPPRKSSSLHAEPPEPPTYLPLPDPVLHVGDRIVYIPPVST
jgi:hypothetical protein